MLSKNRNNLLLLAFFVVFSLFGCNKEEQTDPTEPQEEKKSEDYYAITFCRDNYMNTYYYWADEVKEKNKQLNPALYNMETAFDMMLYQDDRWSWMEDSESYLSSQTGTVTGTWGIAITQPLEFFNDYGVYVRMIYDGSPLQKYGVTRGAQLRAVAGVEIGDRIDSQEKVDAINNHFYDSPNTFTFRLTDGRDTTFTESLATALSTDYIMSKKIFTEKDFPGLPVTVGYLNYLSFNSNFTYAIDDAMKEFSEAGVQKLIIDLRYNGGGSSDACQRLVSYIAPKGLAGEPYLKYTHNSHLSSYDKTRYIGDYNSTTSKYSDISIGADEIFFIMDKYSASSSEVTYNGLRPYLKDKIHLVGGQTFGKPNGMYVLYYPGDNASQEAYNVGNFASLKYVYYPVCFFNCNSEGEKIPSTSEEYSGFVPDNKRPDDVYHDFDVDESAIFACLTYMVTGEYPPVDESHVKKTKASASGRFVNIDKDDFTKGFTNNNYIEKFEKH